MTYDARLYSISKAQYEENEKRYLPELQPDSTSRNNPGHLHLGQNLSREE